MSRELDFSVAQALGWVKKSGYPMGACWFDQEDNYKARVSVFRPSTSWESLGPLMESHSIEIDYVGDGYGREYPLVRIATDAVWQQGLNKGEADLKYGICQAFINSFLSPVSTQMGVHRV